MKTVFDSEMVVHVWAHQSQESGRNSRNNVSFRGDSLYSYSTIIARHITNKRGESAVLLATGYYSKTTCKQQCWARRSCSHLTVFHVSRVDPQEQPRQYLKEYSDQVVELVGKWKRARDRKPYLLDEIRRLVTEANRFAEFHGLRQRVGDPDDMDSMVAASEKIIAAGQAQRRRELRRETKAAAERERKYAERREAWLRGERVEYPPYDDGPVRLRIVEDTLQTSLGAVVPLEHAIKAFRVVQKCRKFKRTYERNGHTIHVGHFAIDSIDEQGNVKVGCHRIEWTEVERVAKQVPGLLLAG